VHSVDESLVQSLPTIGGPVSLRTPPSSISVCSGVNVAAVVGVPSPQLM
jgi:hypothetical protein